ncbi:MAG TPA: hypothetical protein VHC22_24510 [Pirellulales bacterium]|nr:hypothetical protein [Pirellulales bacterium]
MANENDDTPADEIWPGLDLDDLCDDDDVDGDGDFSDAEWEGLLPADDHLPGSETGADWDDDPVTDAWRDATPDQRAALFNDPDFQKWLANKGYVIPSQRPMAESAPALANDRLAQRAAQIARLMYP